VIILVVDDISIAVVKLKDNSPISTDINCPQTFSVTFQAVQPPTWDVHVFNCDGCMQGNKPHSEFLFMVRLNACETATFEEFAQSFMLESFNHVPIIPRVAQYATLFFGNKKRLATSGSRYIDMQSRTYPDVDRSGFGGVGTGRFCMAKIILGKCVKMDWQLIDSSISGD